MFFENIQYLKNKETKYRVLSNTKNKLGKTTKTKKEFEITLENNYSSLCKTDLLNMMMDRDFAVDIDRLIAN